MKRLRDRRNLIIGGVAGAALLGAVALGIGYFVVFAGSSPQKLALSSPTATPSSDSTPSAAAGSWTVASGSQAGYRVREQLAGLSAPSDAVGRTSSVHGSVTISATGKLTLHGVTRTVTIPIDARLSGSQIELVGSITFPFSDFGMTPPSIGGFVSVQDNATMEFQLKLARSGA